MRCAILNAGAGAWAFEEHARRLSLALRVPVSGDPAGLNYLLGWDEETPPTGHLFIPWASVQMAADKREHARLFRQHDVATPETLLLERPGEVAAFLANEVEREWVLKWPIGCGAGGHRMISASAPVPSEWPRPYVVQEFIRLEVPEVYRVYGVAGSLFGWNARRYPPGVKASPWVAHAQGARYELVGPLPTEAEGEGRKALAATGLLDSFGCVDILHAPDGRWLILEVGTDGVFNHVDRDLGLPSLAEEIDRRIAAFHRCARELRSSA